MTMSVHDALEGWAEGRLTLERTFELTGAASVEEMLSMCDACDVARPTNRAYDASALRILAGMEPPPRRPAGHVEGLPPGDRSLREEIRQGTLRRMRRALVEAEAVLQGLLKGGCPPGDERIREAEAARDRLIASIDELA